jgi:hypothetical protein
MVEIRTSYFDHHLWGKSFPYAPSESIQESFDIFIFTVGWEKRCTKIIDLNSAAFNFDNGIILKFQHNAINGWRSEYYRKISEFVETKCIPKNYTLEHLTPVYRTPNSILDVLNFIDDKHKELQKPLKIGFEISSCPRVVFLQILQHCIDNNITNSLSFFYSEGLYLDNISQDQPFTSGDWKTDTIPGYSGKNIDIKKKDYFIVSFGFEEKGYSAWIAERENPVKKVGVLLPMPGYLPEYDSLVKNKLQSFIERLSLDARNYLCKRATASDAIEAWQKLNDLIGDNELNVTLLPYGPKPHSLAMGLKCLTSENFLLAHRTSRDGYRQVDIESNGHYWKYEINNLLYF